MKKHSAFLCLSVVVLFVMLPGTVQGYVTDYRYGDPAPGYNDSSWPLVTYWFDVLIENDFSVDVSGPADAFNVVASLSWPTDPDITILDGVVAVGDIPALGAAWSADTFSISLDVSTRPPDKDFLGLWWDIEWDDPLGTHHIMQRVPEIWPWPASAEDLPDIAPWTPHEVIPAPGALLLGSIGVGLVGWLRRRRTL